MVNPASDSKVVGSQAFGFRSRVNRQTALLAIFILLASWGLVTLGIHLGSLYVPAGAGFPKAEEVQANLFRFDSIYYLNIATQGYSYNGDLNSSPNIVFAPLFPLLIRFGVSLGLDPVTFGFALNKILFFGALFFLLQWMQPFMGWRAAVLTLLALATSAGAYSFHAFYSESTMLFLMALALWSHQREKLAWFAFAIAGLGASRLTALPMAVVAALWFFRVAKIWGFGLLCVAGGAAYLTYIGLKFGNPFVLLPAIQGASWGLFHPETDWLMLVSGGYLFEYWLSAFAKGWAALFDIQVLNLIWTTLGLVSAIYVVAKWRKNFFSYFFLSYFLFIYATNSSSIYLISAHRFFVLMLPIFIMFADLCGRLSEKSRFLGVLAVLGVMLINAFYGVWHTAAFNQGVWYHF